MKNGIKAVVLAAGKGTRLRTEGVDLPKVLRQAAGRPLLGYVLEELSFLEKEDVVLVVGYEREKVLAAYPEYPHAVQEPQQGTGHAVQCAREALAGFDGSVLVCYEGEGRAEALAVLRGLRRDALPVGTAADDDQLRQVDSQFLGRLLSMAARHFLKK